VKRLAAALLVLAAAALPASAAAPASAYDAQLIALARRYQAESFAQSPTYATDSGIRTYDAQLAQFSAQARAAQFAKLVGFRNELAALQPPPGASRHDRVDYLLLRSSLEGDWWSRTVLRGLQRNPTVYEGECADGIFSLIKKPFASAEVRVRDAIARLEACPRVLAEGKANLTDTVREFAQIAVEDVEGGDSLYTTSLDELARGASPATRAQLQTARKSALDALHAYAAWLKANMSSFHQGGFSVGKEQYEWYLRRVLLLPFDSTQVAEIGRFELARDRALEAWEANRDAHEPSPPSQPAFTTKVAFLASYQRALAKLIAFVASHEIVDIPSYIGPFHIVEVPKAVAATYPGGFMNPPGMFDKDPEGFYFVPDFDPHNQSFFAAQARQSVLPVLGHEGIPGHFLQYTYAYHNPDYIRHVSDDGVFAEGWAFYGEEMLMRNGLYENDAAARKQVIHLMRHRATRVGVDVGLHTGTMTLPAAIAYFRKNAGIDEATARGEATRFAMDPGQAIDYLVGKTQIEMLIGLVHDREGAGFSLRRFHDRLLSYGTVPYSTVRYEWLGDDAWLAAGAEPMAPVEFTQP
jgi:uncharacterized protein (DUF885 family)